MVLPFNYAIMQKSLIKSIDSKTTELESDYQKALDSINKHGSKYAVGIGLSFAIVATVVTVNSLNAFFSSYELYFRSFLRNPIVKLELQSPLQNPVVLNEREMHSPVPKDYKPTGKPASPTPTPGIPAITPINPHVNAVKIKVVQASKYPTFINHIWVHESGQGTNTNKDGLHSKCAAKGMSNEFGFYPQGSWCWNTFEEGVARLELWREREAKGLTDNQALCYYNGAGKVDSCAYLTDDYLSMN